jgi:hypothetical protein
VHACNSGVHCFQASRLVLLSIKAPELAMEQKVRHLSKISANQIIMLEI